MRVWLLVGCGVWCKVWVNVAGWILLLRNRWLDRRGGGTRSPALNYYCLEFCLYQAGVVFVIRLG